MARLLAAAQVLILARSHWHRLEPHERRRFIALAAHIPPTPSRRHTLSDQERAELLRLIAKADPRLFAGLVAQRFSPVPLPGRIVRGRR